MKDKCEFCGELEETEGTSTVGGYCIECHKTVIDQSQEAIKIIKQRIRKIKGGKR